MFMRFLLYFPPLFRHAVLERTAQSRVADRDPHRFGKLIRFRIKVKNLTRIEIQIEVKRQEL
jgi:hypothetical protein